MCVTKKESYRVEYSTLETSTEARLVPGVEYKQLRMYTIPNLLCKVAIFSLLSSLASFYFSTRRSFSILHGVLSHKINNIWCKNKIGGYPAPRRSTKEKCIEWLEIVRTLIRNFVFFSDTCTDKFLLVSRAG
jgi:hypothetical protein